MKNDPLNIAISLIFSLNLLEENEEYNINEIKGLSSISQHWITIQKYLNIVTLIQKYSPEIEYYGSKLKLINSKIYGGLSTKQKFILYLYNNHALTAETAIVMKETLTDSIISDSIGYLYEKTEMDKYFLTKSGINIYRSIKHNISNIISNKKEIHDVFGRTKSAESKKWKTQIISLSYENMRLEGIQRSETASNTPIPIELYSQTSSDTILVPKTHNLTE